MANYVLKQPGEVVQDFTINSVIGYYAGEPTYSTTCLSCNTSGVSITHDAFRKGTAKCTSSTHFAAMKEKITAPEPPRKPEPIKVDDYVQNLKAKREAENRQYIGTARDQWNAYISHGIINGWNLQGMIDIHDWLKVLPEHRDEILEKQRSGFYERKTKEKANS